MSLKPAMSPQPCVPEYPQFLRPQVPCGRRQEVEASGPWTMVACVGLGPWGPDAPASVPRGA